jgi:hypothetical protein
MPRLTTRFAELSRRTRAVTSPIWSSGSTTGPLSRKWSIHRSCRGLNNRIRSPEPVNDAIFEPCTDCRPYVRMRDYLQSSGRRVFGLRRDRLREEMPHRCREATSIRNGSSREATTAVRSSADSLKTGWPRSTAPWLWLIRGCAQVGRSYPTQRPRLPSTPIRADVPTTPQLAFARRRVVGN